VTVVLPCRNYSRFKNKTNINRTLSILPHTILTTKRSDKLKIVSNSKLTAFLFVNKD
jgi:hypothetical protein